MAQLSSAGARAAGNGSLDIVPATHWTTELPSVPAPPGYTAALKTGKVHGLTFRGAECKGPHGEWVSSALYEVWPPT